MLTIFAVAVLGNSSCLEISNAEKLISCVTISFAISVLLESVISLESDSNSPKSKSKLSSFLVSIAFKSTISLTSDMSLAWGLSSANDAISLGELLKSNSGNSSNWFCGLVSSSSCAFKVLGDAKFFTKESLSNEKSKSVSEATGTLEKSSAANSAVDVS